MIPGFNSKDGPHHHAPEKLYMGGTQIWLGQGCAAGSSRPIPMFRCNFSTNGYPYLGIFPKNVPILTIAKPGKFGKSEPYVKKEIFFMTNETHVEGIS